MVRRRFRDSYPLMSAMWLVSGDLVLLAAAKLFVPALHYVDRDWLVVGRPLGPTGESAGAKRAENHNEQRDDELGPKLDLIGFGPREVTQRNILLPDPKSVKRRPQSDQAPADEAN